MRMRRVIGSAAAAVPVTAYADVTARVWVAESEYSGTVAEPGGGEAARR